MDKEAINRVIAFFKESLISSGIRVESIALFGSALSGRMDKDSDIDLIIISSDFVGLGLFERAKLTMKAEMDTLKEFMIPLDILCLSPAEYNESRKKIFYNSEIVA